MLIRMKEKRLHKNTRIHTEQNRTMRIMKWKFNWMGEKTEIVNKLMETEEDVVMRENWEILWKMEIIRKCKVPRNEEMCLQFSCWIVNLRTFAAVHKVIPIYENSLCICGLYLILDDFIYLAWALSIFTEFFTLSAHVEDAYLSKVATCLQRCHHSFTIISDNL